jgi:hypothetical protein
MESARYGVWVLIAATAVTVGCKSEADKACEQLVKSTEVSLLSMNPTNQASVRSTLSDLQKTLVACEAVKSKEVPEIQTAIANVQRHLARVEKGEIKPPPPPPGADSLARLEKEGDPDCPKGQGYQHPVLQKYIKCKGPVMVERSYDEVKSYFAKHRIAAASKGAMLRGEQAGVTYTFTFDQVGSKSAPICLSLEAPQDQKTNELIAFATNIEPAKIDPTKPIALRQGTIPVDVKRQGTLQIITLGDCTKTSPMLERDSDGAAQPSAGPAPTAPPSASNAPAAAPTSDPSPSH